MEVKSRRFGMVLSPAEKQALHLLARAERLPEAAVVRRLVWAAAKRAGLADMAEAAAKSSTVHLTYPFDSPEED